MIRRTSIFLASAAVLAAALPAAAQRACRAVAGPHPPGTYLVIGTGAVELALGETRALSAGLSRNWPYSPPEPLPRGCSARWRVDTGAPASIDRRGQLVVRADAAPGTEFMVHAVVGRDTQVGMPVAFATMPADERSACRTRSVSCSLYRSLMRSSIHIHQLFIAPTISRTRVLQP